MILKNGCPPKLIEKKHKKPGENAGSPDQVAKAVDRTTAFPPQVCLFFGRMLKTYCQKI